MKIYETIYQAKESEITTFPGIYYFRNKINNKYYIGQAVNIRNRFCAHYYQIQVKNNKYPIYRAINKYGADNFEFGIIGVFKITLEQNILKKKLDVLEIKYIEEYNSYKNGYNQTLGGDGGILGYKMTESQKKCISEIAKKIANDGRNNIYVYDLIEKKEYLFSSSTEAGKYFNINSIELRKNMKNVSKCYLNRYISARTKEDLYSNIKIYENHKSEKFTNKYSLEEYINLKKENPDLSAVELAKLLGVCKKTIYNYENQLPEELQTFNINKQLILWEIKNIETDESFVVNVYEGAEFFKTSIKNFRHTADRCDKDKHCYRKIYKISKVNGYNI